MDRPNTALSESDAGKQREIRNRKPVREWTPQQRREAFMEARKIEAQRAAAGIVEESELCETCHEFLPDRGFCWCKKCIEQMRQWED
jgi:hypothetical protein